MSNHPPEGDADFQKSDRSARLLRTLRYVEAAGEAGIRPEDLAKKLGVSRRTAYRDLQALEAPAPEAPDDAIESIELSGGGPEQLHVAQHSGPVVLDFPTGVALRARLDQAVLQFVKTGSATPASELAFLCDGLARDLVPGMARNLTQGSGPSAPACGISGEKTNQQPKPWNRPPRRPGPTVKTQ